MNYLQSEVDLVKKRLKDTEQTVKLNKEIISALVDSMQNHEYKDTFRIF